MKGSMTFKITGNASDYRVYISKEGELDTADLELIATLLDEDIKLKRRIESGEIQLTASDPTGIQQFLSHWSN